MGLAFSWSRWFGVKASMSLGSSEEGVIGRSFNIACTSQKIVWKASSFNTCCFTTEHRAQIYFTYPLRQMRLNRNLYQENAPPQGGLHDRLNSRKGHRIS